MEEPFSQGDPGKDHLIRLPGRAVTLSSGARRGTFQDGDSPVRMPETHRTRSLSGLPIVIWEALFQKVAATRLVRRVVDTVLRGRARRRVAELDHESAARSQVRTLLGLVHRAQATRFGQDHDFQRIRTVGDFQRLVPLRTLSRLWQEYWPAPQLLLSQTTWPILPFLALPETPGHWLSSVPLSPAPLFTF